MLLSIVVPTFNERSNVVRVAQEVASALSDIHYELIFIDDSNDDTPIVLEQIALSDARVRFEHRSDERGLGTAVVRGFEISVGDVLAVMDADLQHPPAILREMLNEIDSGADIVIPSRFVPGGSDGGLALHRKIVSAVARYMGRSSLHRLRKITDPTSGFFMFKKSVVVGISLRPIGWKILIEVVARGRYQKIVEIPYVFRPREAEMSKMSLREQWNYILHLMVLVKDSPSDRRLLLFLLVGCSGVVVNMIVYIILVHLHVTVTTAGFFSALVALISNFILNDRITWVHLNVRNRWIGKALRYFSTSLVGIGIDVGVLSVLYHVFHIHYVLANLSGIFVATSWNFIVNDRWTWKNNKTEETKPTDHRHRQVF